MRYLVRAKDLKEKIDFFEKQYTIICDSIENLEKIKPTILWEGPASSKFGIIYDGYMLELKKMAEEILKSLEFVMSFYNNYSQEYVALRNKYRNLIGEGDVHE